MLKYPHINPIAFNAGHLHVHWYGLMYLFSFLLVWALARYRMMHQAWAPLKTNDELLDVIFYGALGVIVGGRIGYVLFYNFSYYLSAPAEVFKVWDGGMSFHGGLLGVIVALWIYAYRKKVGFFALMDFIAPLAPIGLGLGRIGNFINGELWGRVTTSPIGMVFPHAGSLPRYPSQLIEFFLEGVCLFVFLWLISLKPRPKMFVSSWFLIAYSICRIIAEFFRQPDPQVGYLAFGWLTMGQLLSLPMLILGIVLLVISLKKKHEA